MEEIKRKNRINIENRSQNENISFYIEILEKDNKEFIELTFVPNPEKIYKSSDNKRVLYPPSSIPIELEGYNLLGFVSCLISSISMPFENEELGEFKKIRSGRYTVRTRKNIKDTEKAIIDISKNGEQIISFKLNKTKIILLLLLIKETYSKIIETRTFLVKDKNYIFKIHKLRNENIAIGEQVLRNSEIEIIRYIINTLIFDFRYSEKLEDFKKIHRQVLVYSNQKEKIIVLIKKINGEDGLNFAINTEILAALFLGIPEETDYKKERIDR